MKFGHWTVNQKYPEVLKCVAGERWRSVSSYRVRNEEVLHVVQDERHILKTLTFRLLMSTIVDVPHR